MVKSNVSSYKLMPVFLMLVTDASKTNDRDRNQKNDEPNFRLPATIMAEK
jgi:hypothetical protein